MRLPWFLWKGVKKLHSSKTANCTHSQTRWAEVHSHTKSSPGSATSDTEFRYKHNRSCLQLPYDQYTHGSCNPFRPYSLCCIHRGYCCSHHRTPQRFYWEIHPRKLIQGCIYLRTVPFYHCIVCKYWYWHRRIDNTRFRRAVCRRLRWWANILQYKQYILLHNSINSDHRWLSMVNKCN